MIYTSLIKSYAFYPEIDMVLGCAWGEEQHHLLLLPRPLLLSEPEADFNIADFSKWTILQSEEFDAIWERVEDVKSDFSRFIHQGFMPYSKRLKEILYANADLDAQKRWLYDAEDDVLLENEISPEGACDLAKRVCVDRKIEIPSLYWTQGHLTEEFAAADLKADKTIAIYHTRNHSIEFFDGGDTDGVALHELAHAAAYRTLPESMDPTLMPGHDPWFILTYLDLLRKHMPRQSQKSVLRLREEFGKHDLSGIKFIMQNPSVVPVTKRQMPLMSCRHV